MAEPLTVGDNTIRTPFEQLAGDTESINRPRLDGQPEFVSLINHGFVCEWNVPRLRWVVDRRIIRNCSSGQDVCPDRGCCLGELLRCRWTREGVETDISEPWRGCAILAEYRGSEWTCETRMTLEVNYSRVS